MWTSKLLAIAAAAVGAAAAPAANELKFVYLMLENRAFSHYLGYLHPGQPGFAQGTEYNPVDPVNAPDGQRVNISDTAAFVDPDPFHTIPDTAQQMFGRDWGSVQGVVPTMDGFVANLHNHTTLDQAVTVMQSQPTSNVPVISALANEFTLLTHYFSSVPGPTFCNRLYALSATTHGIGTNSANMTITGWPQTSIVGAMARANVSYSLYFEEASTAWLTKDGRTASALSRSFGMERFFADAAAGELASFSWLDPSYFTIPGIVNASVRAAAMAMMQSRCASRPALLVCCGGINQASFSLTPHSPSLLPWHAGPAPVARRA